MSSKRAALMFQLYILLCKMQSMTEDLDHDKIFRHTLLYALESNPSTQEQLAQLFSRKDEDINEIISELEEENYIKKSNEENVYVLSYSGQKIVDSAKNVITKYSAKQVNNLNNDEIASLSKLLNKLLVEESAGRDLEHDYFS